MFPCEMIFSPHRMPLDSSILLCILIVHSLFCFELVIYIILLSLDEQFKYG